MKKISAIRVGLCAAGMGLSGLTGCDRVGGDAAAGAGAPAERLATVEAAQPPSDLARGWVGAGERMYGSFGVGRLLLHQSRRTESELYHWFSELDDAAKWAVEFRLNHYDLWISRAVKQEPGPAGSLRPWRFEGTTPEVALVRRSATADEVQVVLDDVELLSGEGSGDDDRCVLYLRFTWRVAENDPLSLSGHEGVHIRDVYWPVALCLTAGNPALEPDARIDISRGQDRLAGAPATAKQEASVDAVATPP